MTAEKTLLTLDVIGPGAICRNAHFPGMTLLQDRVRLRAFCDTDRARLEKAGREFQVEELYDSVEEMLAAHPDGAVLNTTPTAEHAWTTIACLDAGRDVLCEKPIAMTLEEADAMLEAARRNNRVLQLGLLSRFAPCWLKIKSLIDAGEIGDVMSITMTQYWNQTTLYNDWRTKTSVSGGGIIADSAVHWIDIMRWLLGEMTELTAIGSAAPDSPKQDVDDTAMVLFRFKGGQIGALRNSWRHMRPSNEAETVEIYGTKGTIIGNLQTPWINGGIQHVRLVQPGETRVYTFQEPKLRYANQLNTFFDLVEARNTAAASGPDGRRALEIQLAIYEAMANHSWVRV